MNKKLVTVRRITLIITLSLLSATSFAQDYKNRPEVMEELEAARVSAKQGLYNRELDRVSYDVSKDPDRYKLSMFAMMQKVPNLSLSSKNGNLEYEDMEFEKIIFNDNEIGLINKSRQYPMEFITAAYMSRIEVILPESPEYQNKLPILKITLSQQLPYGAAGNIASNYSTAISYSPGIDIAANLPQVEFGLGYSFDYRHSPDLTDDVFRETAEDIWHSCITKGNMTKSHLFRADLSKALSERIRVLSSGILSCSENSCFTDSYINNSLSSSSVGKTVSPLELNGSINIKGSFDTHSGDGRKIKSSWWINYNLKNTSNQSVTDYSFSQDSTNRLSSEIASIEHRLTGNIGFSQIIIKPFKSSLMLSGGWYNRNHSTDSHNSTGSRAMSYSQNVLFTNIALLNSSLNGKTGLTVRLNGEYVDNGGTFSANDLFYPLAYKEFNLLPVVSFAQQINSRHQLSCEYARRVKRPDINKLNPYVEVIDIYNLRTGNPQLKGEISNHIETKYTYSFGKRSNMSLGSYYEYTSNAISSFTRFDPTGVATVTYANIESKSSVGIIGELRYNIRNNISLTTRGTIRRDIFYLPDSTTNYLLYPLLTATFNWKGKLFDFSSHCRIFPSALSSQTIKMNPEPSLECTVSKYFQKPHLGISIGCSDILHNVGSNKYSVTQYGNYTQYDNIGRQGRVVSFRLYWRFGKFKQINVGPASGSEGAYDM